MTRRTLMQRDRELVDFEVDPVTGEARIIDIASDNLAAFLGLARENRNQVLTTLMRRRALSPLRKDKDDVLAAFGAKSSVDLALMGHGLSLSDQFWYRAPGSSERWKDVNFFDNAWDPGFGVAVLLGDYARLATCSPDVPEVTTPGHAIKAWERNSDGIYLVKAAEYPDGVELVGAKLGFDLCSLLFGEDYCVPLDVAERYGRPCSISPLMLDGDEELADGNRLCAMTDMWESAGLSKGGITAEACDALVDAYMAIGAADASAHVARRACFSYLSLLLDFNPGNFGVVRKIDSDVWRVAPIFDYDGAFGFPFKGVSISYLCENPSFVELFCAHRFSFLKSSWDWSWWDLRALDNFEDAIMEAYASCLNLPPVFAELIAHLFCAQCDYVNKVASGEPIRFSR
ncbi:MAG: hypothetical protein IKE43_07030 [Coriobacteriales bacterium]|nr:hypothetical protein [Coriobacteriales bacterium]